jgi:hypothetical protein
MPGGSLRDQAIPVTHRSPTLVKPDRLSPVADPAGRVDPADPVEDLIGQRRGLCRPWCQCRSGPAAMSGAPDQRGVAVLPARR